MSRFNWFSPDSRKFYKYLVEIIAGSDVLCGLKQREFDDKTLEFFSVEYTDYAQKYEEIQIAARQQKARELETHKFPSALDIPEDNTNLADTPNRYSGEYESPDFGNSDYANRAEIMDKIKEAGFPDMKSAIRYALDKKLSLEQALVLKMTTNFIEKNNI